MMAFYGLSDEQVLKMPVARFWMLSRAIDRIAAERDMRALRVAASAQASEAIESLFESLGKEVGVVVEIDEDAKQAQEARRAQEDQLDRVGLAALKM